MRSVWQIVIGLCVSGALVSPTSAEEELKKLVDRILKPPTIQAESGFTAKVLIPPGHLYDPLWMLPQEGAVWLNDDGGEEKGKGSRLLSLDPQGKISVLAGVGKLLPVTGFDIAPKGFGDFAGQIFTLAQAESGTAGVTKNHVIQRVDPQQDYTASVVCTLKELGEGKIAGVGADARFGPEGSPYAGKFYGATAMNNTIYQVTADGKCAPFITFDDQVGAPFAIAFSPDGKVMYVSVTRGGFFSPTSSTIVRVTPDGKVDGKPLVESKTPLTGIDVAPEGFGAYAGQLFVGEIGKVEVPVPMTQPLTPDGKLHRVTPEGKLELVASGFLNAAGVRFIGKKLWVTDINGDFIAGRRELPDGFLVEITAQ